MFTLVLMGALAILLAKLALLQYQWVGQNAEHERQTMQTALHNLAIDFEEKFDREIHRAYSYAEMNGEALRHGEYNEIVERYAKWGAAAPYPGLIKNVFLAVAQEDNSLTLMRLEQSTGRFQPSDWPPNLAWLGKKFDPELVRKSNEAESKFGRMAEHGYIAGEIPAVLRFYAGRDRAMFSAQRLGREVSRERMVEELRANSKGEASLANTGEKEMKEGHLRELGFAIIELDPDYIKQVFIPALAKLSFYRGLDYDLAVVNRTLPSDGIIYRTSQEPQNGSLRSSDENVSILATAIDANTPSDGADWHVLVKHRAGSVEAAVARLRFRNLAVSFGILFLLAASVIIIIINSRRSQQLARKQMEFVAGVSHEFRTPLAVIHAISENLADGLITDKQEIERCGMVIRDDVRRLATMVEEVLQLAGAFRGKALYHRAPVDLAPLIEQVLARYPQLNEGLGWHLEKEIEGGLPLGLADSTALASALGNILDNAIKYGGDARWIRVKVRSQSRPTPGVVVTVEDRGRGIATEDLPHIFEPFYRGAEVRAAQIHGNGLGLSLVKNIVDAHGGTISVERSAGKGTAFILTLPAASPAVTGAPSPATSTDQQSPATVG